MRAFGEAAGIGKPARAGVEELRGRVLSICGQWSPAGRRSEGCSDGEAVRPVIVTFARSRRPPPPRDSIARTVDGRYWVSRHQESGKLFVYDRFLEHASRRQVFLFDVASGMLRPYSRRDVGLTVLWVRPSEGEAEHAVAAYRSQVSDEMRESLDCDAGTEPLARDAKTPHRSTHGFRCKESLESPTGIACEKCGWLACRHCGACGCEYVPANRRDGEWFD